MKLFSLFTTITATATALAPVRTITDTESRIDFTGEEDPDQLLKMIVEISGSEADEIEQAIMAMMGVDRIETDQQVRKFRQLKIIVLFLQKSQKFGRFCYYGCYCLPEGSHNIAAGGYGRPKDNIDRACFDFKTCYRCLVEQHDDDQPTPNGKCVGEELGYRFTLIHDKTTDKKEIVCRNKLGSCRRNICECDKRLSLEFAKYEDQWDMNLHSNKGGFDREQECHANSGVPVEHCCGNRESFPYNELKHKNQCCDGPFAKEAGTC